MDTKTLKWITEIEAQTQPSIEHLPFERKKIKKNNKKKCLFQK